MARKTARTKPTQIVGQSFGWIISGLLYVTVASAETIYLKDGSSFQGSIVHFFESSLQVILASGDSLTLKKSDLDKIVFTTDGAAVAPTKVTPNPPSGDGNFATPKKTVEFWIRALKKNDIEMMASCFIESARAPMIQKLKEIPTEQQKKIVRDAKKTDFEIDKININGERATLTLRRILNNWSSDEELSLARESGSWKLLPNE